MNENDKPKRTEESPEAKTEPKAAATTGAAPKEGLQPEGDLGTAP